MVSIVASGTVPVNVSNDVGTHAVNGLGGMLITDTVFLQVYSGGNARNAAYPSLGVGKSGEEPLFLANVTSKSAGGFNFVVVPLKENNWHVDAVNVDYLVMRP